MTVQIEIEISEPELGVAVAMYREGKTFPRIRYVSTHGTEFPEIVVEHRITAARGVREGSGMEGPVRAPENIEVKIFVFGARDDLMTFWLRGRLCGAG
jgi:hypothetical protein